LALDSPFIIHHSPLTIMFATEQFSIIQPIVLGLQYLNPYTTSIADIFLILYVSLLIFAIYKRGEPVALIVPTLLTSLALIGTLLIASIGISVFDVNDFEKSVVHLLNKLGIAFIIGFVGLVLVLFIKTINKKMAKSEPKHPGEVTPAAIYSVLKEISVHNSSQNSRLANINGQLKELQQTIQKGIDLQQANFAGETRLLENIKSSLTSDDEISVGTQVQNLYSSLQTVGTQVQNLHSSLQSIKGQFDKLNALDIEQARDALLEMATRADTVSPAMQQIVELVGGLQQQLDGYETSKMPPAVQRCLNLLETSLETQLDMTEASLETQLEGFEALQESFAHLGKQAGSVEKSTMVLPTVIQTLPEQIGSETTPSELDTLKPGEYEDLQNQAFQFMELGHYEKAITSFDKLISFNPTEFSSFYNKACCHGLRSQTDLAIKALQQAISLNAECRVMANTDSDFDYIRYDVRFQNL
jgi:tetratricopeptide (TPR) repeat protein